MASYRSDLAAEIKERLTARQVIEAYGFHPNRAGYIQCPFHAGDRHGSLKIYDGDKTGWHCFGCGAGSTVIDFVMKLFNINFRQACLRLDADFSLGLTGKMSSAAEISAVLAARFLLSIFHFPILNCVCFLCILAAISGRKQREKQRRIVNTAGKLQSIVIGGKSRNCLSRTMQTRMSVTFTRCMQKQ